MAGRAFGLWFPNNDRRDLSFFVGPTLIGLCWTVICLSFLVSTVQMVAAQPALESVIPLTAEEQAWLKAHPDIQIGYTDAFEPEVITNPDGSYSGILVDFLDELNRRLGTRIRLRIDPIPELFGKAQKRETDGILYLLPEYADKLGLLKTEGHLTGYAAVFARKNVVFDRPSDFAGKKVAIIDGVMFSEKIIERYGAGATILKVKDALEGLQRVDKEEADLFLGASINAYFLAKYQLFGLALQYVFYDHPFKGGMAIRSDWPELVPILNKGISSFSENEIEAITAKWISIPEKQQVTVELTPEERAWLGAHPNIQLGYTDEYEPQVIVNPDGTYRGILIDFLAELNRRLGTRIDLHFDSTPGILEKAKTKAVDGILEIHPEYADKLGLLKSAGYLTAYPAVFARQDVSFEGPADFAGKRVAIIDKVYFSEKLVRQYGEQATILKVKDAEQGMKAVSAGDADLFIGVSYNSYLLTKYQLFDVVAKYTFLDYPDKFGMAIRPDWPDLIPILNKGIASFSQNEIDAIVAKWVHIPYPKDVIALTPEEQAWLAQNHTVRVRVANAEPYIFLSEGKPQGIAVDLLNLISLRTGVKFRYIIPSPSFADDLEKIARYEGPDLISTIMRTPERDKFLLFTKDYSSSPRFIFTRDDSEFVGGMDDLSGKTVAVINAFVVHKYLKRNHPEIHLSVYKDVEDSLKAVSSGKAYAFIGDLKFTPIMITKLGLYNLKMAAPSSLPDHVQAMATRNDWPELQSILNKGLDSISEEEKAAIVNKWTTIKVAYGIKPTALIKWGLLIVVGAFGTIFFFVLWNRTLAKRVRQRTLELEGTTESLKTEIAEKNQTETALKTSRRFIDNLIETANVIIVGLDAAGDINLFNPAAERITGYTISELRGKNWFKLLVPQKRYPQVHQEFSRVLAGGLPKLFENPILTKNGEERVISWSNNEIKEGDQIVGILSFGMDITERKRAEEAFRVSEEQFRQLVEQAPFSIQLMTPEGRITQVNQEFMDLWGFDEDSLSEILEKYNILEDEEAIKRGVMPFIERAFKGETVVLPVIEYDSGKTMDALGVDTASKKVWIEVRLYPVKDEKGEIVRVVEIEEDITKRVLAEQEILQYQQRLKALASQLTLTEEKERRAIAADLHDHVGHSLALARMQLNSILESTSKFERNILVKDISNVLLQALQETRSLIFELSSPSMNDIGLGAAISEWLEEQIEKRHGLITEFSDTIKKEHRKTLNENVRSLVFRNVRELLTNVVKHARANKVTVHLKDHDNKINIIIEDDGIGFDLGALKAKVGPKGGFGLFSIKERMSDLGGTFDIQSDPGRGCRVVLTVSVEET